MSAKSRKAGPYEIPLKGLVYVGVDCAECSRPFIIPRLPDDPVDPQSEGLHCESCARKRDRAVARLTRQEAKGQRDLFRG